MDIIKAINQMGNMWNTRLTFRGVYEDFPDTAQYGEVILIGKNEYVYDGEWIEIGDTEIKEKKIPKNCPNCGGIINPFKLKCEFCGTYWGQI